MFFENSSKGTLYTNMPELAFRQSGIFQLRLFQRRDYVFQKVRKLRY